LIIFCPFRLLEAKGQVPDLGFEALNESGQGNGTDPTLPHPDLPSGEIFLAQGVEMDVRGQTGPQPGSERKKPAGQAHGNPVDENPGKLVEMEVLVGDKEQRVEKMLTELAVGHPGSHLELLEGQRIDEKGPPVYKLDVEGAGVFEGHFVFKSSLLDFEHGQSGFLELGETPLVRIGNEGDDLRLYDLIGPLRVGRRDVGFIMADKQSLFRQRLIQSAGEELIVMVPVDKVDLSAKRPFPFE
jgi:hypothetical protein